MFIVAMNFKCMVTDKRLCNSLEIFFPKEYFPMPCHEVTTTITISNIDHIPTTEERNRLADEYKTAFNSMSKELTAMSVEFENFKDVKEISTPVEE